MRLSEIHNPVQSKGGVNSPYTNDAAGLGKRARPQDVFLQLVHSVAVAAAHMSYAGATRIQRRERTVGMSCGRCPYDLRTELGGICRVQGIKNESRRHKHHRGDERNRQLRHLSLPKPIFIALLTTNHLVSPTPYGDTASDLTPLYK
jgi:hypothetical protein